MCSFCQTVVRKGGSKKNRAGKSCRFKEPADVHSRQNLDLVWWSGVDEDGVRLNPVWVYVNQEIYVAMQELACEKRGETLI